MKVYDLLIDVLNVIFIILITFFVFLLIESYCTSNNMPKFTLMFTLLINNFIISNYSRIFSYNTSYIENTLLISFILTLVLITFKWKT